MAEQQGDAIQAILDQLALMNQALQAQQRSITGLQQAAQQRVIPQLLGPLGDTGDGEEDAPEASSNRGDPGADGSGSTQAESDTQHGIRASELWRSTTALSKDAFKPAFKLDSGKEYPV